MRRRRLPGCPPSLASLVLLLCASGGCTPDAGPPGDPRARLRIPADAKTVVVFAQTAHLDIDWQKTFPDYYDSYVDQIFHEARQILDDQPAAFYSIAEMAYLEQHLQKHPEEAQALAGHAQRGALRIVGGGMTSPDTVMPETELLLRDLLHGDLFVEQTLGAAARPRSAWLPDSFGHAATAPDVLAAAGYDSVAFARIDGGTTLFEQIKRTLPPHPGSDAEMLAKLGSADFVWRGPGGGEVLAHYLSDALYCTGDNIDYDEPLQVPGDHIGLYEGDDPSFTDHQIDGYVAALQPYAKTPYLFVPVGCDFQHPKDRLLEYLSGYNQRHYGDSGVYAVAATFADYAQLLAPYRDALPVLDHDLTPYFMGFYGSRAGVKRRTRDATRPVLAAETFATALGDAGAARMQAAAPALRKLTRADHHDFVTGTSTDDVVASEQLPLLDEAEAAGQAAFSDVAAGLLQGIPPAAADGTTPAGRLLALNPSGTAQPAVAEVDVSFAPPLTRPSLHAMAGGTAVPLEVLSTQGEDGQFVSAHLRLALPALPPFSFQAVDLLPGDGPAPPRVTLQLLDAQDQPATGAAVARVVLANERVRAEWRRQAGGGFALVSGQIDGTEALAAPSFLVQDYRDGGGLWRMGQEMSGCSLDPLPAGPVDEDVVVLQAPGPLAGVAFRDNAAGGATREAWLGAGDGGLTLALTTGAAEGTTRTASFSLAVPAGAPLRTSQAGGFAERVPDHVYTPTFWPVVAWVSSGPWAVLLRQSTGARFDATGGVELVAVRDARSEQCDVLGGVGSDTGTHRIEWQLVAAAGAAAAEQSAQAFNRPPVLVAQVPGTAAGTGPALPAQQSLAQVDGAGVVSALKPADRGGGVILRALLLPGPLTIKLGAPLSGKRMTRVDATEHDLEELGPAGDTLTLDRDHFGAIATVRLH